MKLAEYIKQTPETNDFPFFPQMATSRSGAGGKIVTNRRKQRLAATPYDRPPPQPLPPPPPKSRNWFTGIIVPSARALATGAGKIFSSIFSESESSSSEDEDSASGTHSSAFTFFYFTLLLFYFASLIVMSAIVSHHCAYL